jgi:hypothetical protein
MADIFNDFIIDPKHLKASVLKHLTFQTSISFLMSSSTQVATHILSAVLLNLDPFNYGVLHCNSNSYLQRDIN